MTACLQTTPILEVEVAPTTLQHKITVPVQPHPLKVLNRGARELLLAAQGIQVFDAKKKPAPSLAGTTMGFGKSPRMAEMKATGRCRSHAPSVSRRCFLTVRHIGTHPSLRNVTKSVGIRAYA